jgi:hypothetical protein
LFQDCIGIAISCKFEDECRMEFENVNRAYDTLVKPKMKRISKPGKEKQALQ